MDCKSGSRCARRQKISGSIADNMLGVTPFVKPDSLKFFFEEIHRLSTTGSHRSTTL